MVKILALMGQSVKIDIVVWGKFSKPKSKKQVSYKASRRSYGNPIYLLLNKKTYNNS